MTYISREAAIKTQDRMCLGCPCNRTLCVKCAANTFKRQIMEIPAADVRPVVTCDQCNWCVDLGDHPYCEMLAMLCPNGGDWFCAYGEQPRYAGTEAEQ